MLRQLTIRFILTAVAAVLLAPASGAAQTRETGVLLLAHGGSESWNEEVLRIVRQVDSRIPVEAAFGMASRGSIQEAADRLAARGVERIVAVPLFISPHSSIITSTEYLLGLRAAAPPELALYAAMNHGAADAQHAGHAPDAAEAMQPIRSSAAVSMTPALGRHPLVADILLSRANALSRAPENEVVIVVAHGPSSEEENAMWLADMQALAAAMAASVRFHRIDYMTVRDDAAEPVRSQAASDLRALVETAVREGKRALIVPLLLSFGGIEQGIRDRLDGLSYDMSQSALLPDDRIAEWILLQAGVQ